MPERLLETDRRKHRPLGVVFVRYVHEPWASGAHLAVSWAQIEPHQGQFAWRVIEAHPIVVEAVRLGKPFGLQIRLQGTPTERGIPAWAKVPASGTSTRQNRGKVWPAIWSDAFQRAFPPFVCALAAQYDGDPRLAYVVMTDATAIPYAQNPRLWDKAGFTSVGYKQAYQHMYQTYRQAFRKTPLAATIDGFAHTNAQALRGQPEGQALRELLAFAGGEGFHFFFADDMPQGRSGSSYLKDEILLPVLRKYAPRSQVLVMLPPSERPLGEGSGHMVQVAQVRWPELPIRAVVLDQANASTPGRQTRPTQHRPTRRLLVLGDTPGL